MIRVITRQTVFAFAFALVLATVGSIAAWTGPTQSPPDGNVAAPINTGSTAQTKTGDLNITGSSGLWATGVGSDNGYCIGTDCISAWSDVGGGGLSQWTASTNTISYTAGNVGILTTDPKSPLQVGQLGFMTSWPGIYFNTYWDNSASVHKYLTTNSASFIQQDYTNGGLAFFTAPSGPANSNLWDTPGTSMALFLKGNGNIGVGTTNPGSLLTVNGIIQSTQGGVTFPDGTTQTTAGNYQVSCAVASSAFYLVCCQMSVNTGNTICKVSTGGGWTTYTNQPFTASVSSRYSLSCGGGYSGPIGCCRTDVSSGSTSCVRATDLSNSTWTTLPSPF